MFQLKNAVFVFRSPPATSTRHRTSHTSSQHYYVPPNTKKNQTSKNKQACACAHCRFAVVSRSAWYCICASRKQKCKKTTFLCDVLVRGSINGYVLYVLSVSMHVYTLLFRMCYGHVEYCVNAVYNNRQSIGKHYTQVERASITHTNSFEHRPTRSATSGASPIHPDMSCTWKTTSQQPECA